MKKVTCHLEAILFTVEQIMSKPIANFSNTQEVESDANI